MKEFVYIIKDFIQGVHPLIIYILIFLFGLYVFWRGCTESRKNRSSVFDIFLVSGFLGSVVGRVVYIITTWESFSSYIWYWLPYEKYGDKIYLFRLLPWRFFSVWDGGLVILGMFISMLIFLTFFSLVIKKWRWKHMFFPIYFSSTTMLGVSFIYTGIASGFNEWIYKGLILIIVLLFFFLFFKFIYKIVKNPLYEKYILGYVGLLTVLISSVYIVYLYISSDLTLLEDILVGIFLIWTLVMSAFFLSDLRRARVNIKSVSTIRSVKLE